jgi:hypothetical protein
VDFLIKRRTEFIAIEVKAKESLPSRDFLGLKAISELKGVRRRILGFLGDRPYKTEDGIDVLPMRNFLQELGEKYI